MNHRKSSCSSSASSHLDSCESGSEKGYDLVEGVSSDEEGAISEEEDSDDEPDDDEDEESDGTDTLAFIDQVESSFLALLEQTVEKVENEHDKSSNSQPIKLVKLNTVPRKNVRDEETQTDVAAPQESENNETAVSVGPDSIRREISCLRDARDSLVNQRKEVADRIKQKMSEDEEADEKKLYEFEEAIEAVDYVIEFKNELLCGRDCILSNCVAPGTNEADLVTRLTNLTTLDLQRLLWKYFSKVVELRYSSKRLEKQIEELENSCTKLSYQLKRNEKSMKDQQAEYENRIIFCLQLQNKNSNTAADEYIKTLSKQLDHAHKKHVDLERSLTELLTRHGYLANGADYDVKQVVKMLGIDTTQMGLNWSRTENKSKYKPGTSGSTANGNIRGLPLKFRQAVESGAGSQSITRRKKETYSGQRRPGISGATNGHHQLVPSRDFHLHDSSEYRHAAQQSPPPQNPHEVKRKHKRIVIRSRSPDGQ